MVGLEGQHWKSVRSIFNPGFSANHLMTLVPYIVDASLIFCKAIREKAESNELFPLEESATRLTIDIIGKVVLDSDFHSQKSNHPIVDTFRQRTEFMPRAEAVLDLSWLEYPRRLRLWLNGRKLDKLIGAELDRKMASRAAENGTPASSKERKRSVIDLALDAYVKEQATDTKKPTLNAKLNSNFRKNAIDQMKTFIFAGHDTTASTIAYTFYLLHLHPEVHRAMVVELDEVFGSGASTASIAQAIKSEPHLINRLEYITAVIKETLRLFPPASTLRYQPPASDASKDLFMVHPTTGQKLPLSGFHIWPAALLISRNETYFPKPVEFIPERFIPALTPFPEAKLFTPAGKDAWRPFEKGPRGCIGQELAMIESKIILALTVRDYDFTAEIDGVQIENITPIETYKEYADGKSGEERMTVEGHRCFQVLKGAAKPRAGMPGRMSLR